MLRKIPLWSSAAKILKRRVIPCLTIIITPTPSSAMPRSNGSSSKVSLVSTMLFHEMWRRSVVLCSGVRRVAILQIRQAGRARSFGSVITMANRSTRPSTRRDSMRRLAGWPAKDAGARATISVAFQYVSPIRTTRTIPADTSMDRKIALAWHQRDVPSSCCSSSPTSLGLMRQPGSGSARVARWQGALLRVVTPI